jgi:hypothetical protein
VIVTMLVHKLKVAALAASSLSLLAVAGAYAAGQIGRSAPAPGQAKAELPATPDAQPATIPLPGMGGTPGLSPVQLKLPTLSNDSIVAAVPKDGRSITAMLVEIGDWQEYKAPEGTRIRPVLSNNVLAVQLSGDEVREIAALGTSPRAVSPGNFRGTWVRQTLRAPARGEVSPIFATDLVYYEIGGDIYAFSATTNGWDTLHLEGAERPRILANGSKILVEQGDTLYVFAASHGKWSKGLQVPGGEAK